MALPLGRAWRNWRKPAEAVWPVDSPQSVIEGHVVVAGFGRSGKAVARVLQAAGIPLIAVELNHSVFSGINAGIPCVWGDITGEEVLHASQIETAKVLLLTIPDLNTIQLCIERARRMNPGIVVIARAAREHHVSVLKKLGVDVAVQSEFEGGVEMVRQALVRYESDELTTAHLVAEVRKEFYDAGDT